MRPLGVTLIAILYFISAGLLSLAGIASILGAGFASYIASQHPDMGDLGAMLLGGAGIFLAVFFLVIALLCGLEGRGLWKLKNWARTVAMVLAIIGVLFSGLGLLGAMVRFSAFGLLNQGIQFAINLLILWYLNQPHVKLAFGGASPAAPRFSVPPPAPR
jgi:hypothetical protein